MESKKAIVDALQRRFTGFIDLAEFDLTDKWGTRLRYSESESFTKMAVSLGISRHALFHYMIMYCREQFQDFASYMLDNNYNVASASLDDQELQDVLSNPLVAQYGAYLVDSQKESPEGQSKKEIKKEDS